MQNSPDASNRTPTSVREQARQLLDRASATKDLRRRRRLRLRAFELAQVAQLLEAEEWSLPRGPIIGHPRRVKRNRV
jgi:hypothetical protein